MIITCPNCITNYDIDAAGVGPKGRQVKCANCASFWHVEPEMPVAAVANGAPVASPIAATSMPVAKPEIAAVEESILDQEFVAAENSLDDTLSYEELADQMAGLPVVTKSKNKNARRGAKETELANAKSAQVAREDVIDIELDDSPTEAENKRQTRVEMDENAKREARMKRIAKRNRTLANSMPAARVYRIWSITSVTALCAMLLLIVISREPMVRLLPDLASLYRIAGIEVNILGLEFDQIKTERRHDNGRVSLVVSGSVKNITKKPIELPKVLVSLQTSSGEEVYAWSIDPAVPYLDVAEMVEFETLLSAPPAIADHVKLSFLSHGR